MKDCVIEDVSVNEPDAVHDRGSAQLLRLRTPGIFLREIITAMVSPNMKKRDPRQNQRGRVQTVSKRLQVQKRTWYDFFRTAREMGAVFKRTDIAINDRAGILNIPELAEKCRRDECVNDFP
ncbi:MAG: hypothetical protein ACLRP8_13455 [Roseburia intestinalis]